MAWASSGGYPGVASDGSNGLTVAKKLQALALLTTHGGFLQIGATSGPDLLFLSQGSNNGGAALAHAIGLFGHAPPAAATVGGAATAGGTYTAAEQAMLNAAYAALRSIGLIT